MAIINSKMIATKGPVEILCIVACLLMSASQAGAETEKTRTVYRLSKTEVLEVGDLTGHIIGVVEQKGLSFSENGEVGTYSGCATFDYINGSGKHEAYSITTYEDGSTIVTKSQGTTKASEDGKISVFEGTFTYTGGTGRFKGIKGKGSYTGKRVAPLDVGADSYNDVTSTYTVPSK